MALRVGIKHSGQDCTIEQLRDVWATADQAGFDHLWAFDHMASIGPGGPDRPVFEGWSLLAGMATSTRSVRIGLNVTGNTYRNPAMLAKIATTVDHLSGGRLEFGIGAAWAEVEHSMYGIGGLDHRVGRFSESLRIIRSLWTEERTNFQGRYYTMTDAISNPKPVQKPHPPIWIGAGGDMTMKLTARYADVWNPSGAAGRDRASLERGNAQLDQLCRDIGRDPATLRRSVQVRWDGNDANQLVEQIGDYAGIGIGDFLIYVAGPEAPRMTADAATTILPQLRSLRAGG
ncbi:MAG: TIGR03560 family F420-dependent LLM class oxidoreductase [Chloroflexi bacterium]|nr:TIGR03560 family F420-dependent LLM class oxidoreductase [Chloroflexota bacterium]